MSTTVIRLINEVDRVSADCGANEEDAESRRCQDEIRWTTKQVIAACLWSALFGLGCGYAWLFLQIGTAGCR
jgi:hypothetical protein